MERYVAARCVTSRRRGVTKTSFYLSARAHGSIFIYCLSRSGKSTRRVATKSIKTAAALSPLSRNEMLQNSPPVHSLYCLLFSPPRWSRATAKRITARASRDRNYAKARLSPLVPLTMTAAAAAARKRLVKARCRFLRAKLSSANGSSRINTHVLARSPTHKPDRSPTYHNTASALHPSLHSPRRSGVLTKKRAKSHHGQRCSLDVTCRDGRLVAAETRADHVQRAVGKN